MADAYPTLTQCAIVSIALKILLFPAYRSTDFEVHRNWLAITHSLPVRQWYLDHTSEWTLDYPPFFAYFEWALSQVARLVDPAMLRVYNVEYDGWKAVYFQRGSVIATELLLVLALQMYVDSTAAALPAGPKSRAGAQAIQAAQAAAISVLLSPGLLIIDHIHFQYNGFLYGILVLSLVLARSRSTLLWSGLAFAALLCLKHIYLYLAPAYFVYLLRTYCLSPRSVLAPRWANCCRLGGGIAVVAAAAFGPFAALGQLPQLLARLFPFSRGLCHAYWAPNVWAVYSLVDRVLIVVAPRLGLEPREQALAGATRGLVGDSAFAILPDVTPRACFLLTVLFQAPALVRLFVRPSWDAFVGAVTLCGYAAFLFGWHVHEKAILLVVVPFSLIAARDRRHLGAFRPLAVAAHLSLFPLLFTPAEFPIKALYTVFWLMLFLLALGRLAPASDRARRVFLLDRLGTAYAGAGVALVAYCSGLHQMLAFGDRYEFLPLMLTSVYSAVGVIASWLGFMVVYFTT